MFGGPDRLGGEHGGRRGSRGVGLVREIFHQFEVTPAYLLESSSPQMVNGRKTNVCRFQVIVQKGYIAPSHVQTAMPHDLL